MNKYIQTPWTSAENVVGKLQIGDLLEFRRCPSSGIPLYSHWGVYIGLIDDIHEIGHFYYGENDNKLLLSIQTLFSYGSTSGGTITSIRIDNLFDICLNGQCRINNSFDKECEPLPKGDFRSRVLSKVGESRYCLLSNNCEHFAKWVRYDISISRQANIGKAIIGGSTGLIISKNLFYFCIGSMILLIISGPFIPLAVGLSIYFALQYFGKFRRRSSRYSINLNRFKSQMTLLN
uniref:LRAT domain-containing protein n=1 Tax=Strongyloides papillosus TaxID=174720 RepID=A0A0N5BI18_STREA